MAARSGLTLSLDDSSPRRRDRGRTALLATVPSQSPQSRQLKPLRGFGLVGEAPGWVACGQACAGALEQRRRRRRRREGVEELVAVDLVAASAFLGGDGGGARDAFEQTDLAEVRLGAHGAQALLG